MLLSTLRGVSCEARVQTLEGNRTWTLGPSAIHDLSAGPWLPIVNEALAAMLQGVTCWHVWRPVWQPGLLLKSEQPHAVRLRWPPPPPALQLRPASCSTHAAASCKCSEATLCRTGKCT